MKRITKAVAALLLAVLMLIPSLAGCSAKGKTLMKLGDQTISVNMYQLYLSRMKGMLCSSYVFGEAATKPSFWDTVMTVDGVTRNEYYTKSVLDNAKTYLAALYEFDQRGLKLSKKTLDDIDKRLDELIEYDANGSKTTFNSMLSEYGVNYDILREAYIIEEKIAYLKDDIYGANGELISKDVIDLYYEENYARFKQVFFYTCDYVYLTDDNGDDIYFDKNGDVAYDTSATLKTDEKGNEIYVWVDENGKERIAYDKKNGKRENKTDSSGSAIVNPITDEARLQEILDSVALVEGKTKQDDFEGFDKMADIGEENTNGIYITVNSDYYPQVIEAVFDMKVGEVRTVQSDYGIHVLMRYELEKDGYKKSANSDFFISTNTGNYVFMPDLKNMLLSKKLEPYKENIIVDTSLLEGIDIKNAGINPRY